MRKNTKVIKLPRGMGSITQRKESNRYEYKKIVMMPNGITERKSVYGKTESECFEKMAALEEQLRREMPIKPNKQLLIDALLIWIEKKRPILKEQSFNREV